MIVSWENQSPVKCGALHILYLHISVFVFARIQEKGRFWKKLARILKDLEKTKQSRQARIVLALQTFSGSTQGAIFCSEEHSSVSNLKKKHCFTLWRMKYQKVPGNRFGVWEEITSKVVFAKQLACSNMQVKGSILVSEAKNAAQNWYRLP